MEKTHIISDKLFSEIVSHIRQSEEQIEGEWGSGRSIEKMIEYGDAKLYNIVSRIANGKTESEAIADIEREKQEKEDAIKKAILDKEIEEKRNEKELIEKYDTPEKMLAYFLKDAKIVK